MELFYMNVMNILGDNMTGVIIGVGGVGVFESILLWWGVRWGWFNVYRRKTGEKSKLFT